MSEEAKGPSPREQIFPLSLVLDKWTLAAGEVKSVPSNLIAAYHALDATLITLKKLYCLPHEGWRKIREKVKIGIVKDTEKYGNTSVSMGAAAEKPDKLVGFLNCGTGGIKYQLYGRDGCLHLVGEHKPKGGASVQPLAVDKYNPKDAVPVAQVRDQLQKELAAAPWGERKDIPLYAFVTGTIRQYWEENPKSRPALEELMKKLFENTGVKCLGTSYFMTQEEEGRLELIAARTLYANLVEAGELDRGLAVVGSFGIGRGSCQWMTLKPDGTGSDLIPHRAGMEQPAELAKVGNTVVETYKDKPAKLELFLKTLALSDQPIIALKSGCCLVLDQIPDVRARLLESAPTREPYFVQMRKVNGLLQRIETIAGSLTRLCALASDVLTDDDLVLVFSRRLNKIITDISDVGPEDVLVFGRAGESFTGEALVPDAGGFSAPTVVIHAVAPQSIPTAVVPVAPSASLQRQASVTARAPPNPKKGVVDVTAFIKKFETKTKADDQKRQATTTVPKKPELKKPEITVPVSPRPSSSQPGLARSESGVGQSTAVPATPVAAETPVHQKRPPLPVSVRKVGEAAVVETETFIIVDSMDFWVQNPSNEEIEIRSAKVLDMKDGAVLDQPSTHFSILPPVEIRFRQSDKIDPKNTFTVTFAPLDEGTLSAQVNIVFWDVKQGEEISTLRINVEGTCDWMAKLSQHPVGKSLTDISFDLKHIPDKWQLVVPALLEPRDESSGGDIEMTNGFHSCLSTLKELYNMENPKWVEIRDRIKVGLIKETQDCGNSSVSMGLAVAYFKHEKTARFAAFLNCGTGGTKYQLYVRLESGKKHCSVIGESKPGKGAVSQISPVGNYYPDGYLRRQSLEEVRAELSAGMGHAPWKRPTFLESIKESAFTDDELTELKNIIPFAFITGSIRNHWALASDDMKEDMEKKMEELFCGMCNPVGSELLSQQQGGEPKKSCFFLSQEQEGEMEHVACRILQKAVDKKQERAKKHDSVACLGIGSGSCQFTIRIKRKKKKEHVVIKYPFGMRSPQDLRRLGRTVIADPLIKEFISSMRAAIDGGRIPMIVLKSGCLLRLGKFPKERVALCAPPEIEHSTFRVAQSESVASWTQAVPREGSVNLARGCAEAEVKSKSKDDLVRVFKNGEIQTAQYKLSKSDTLVFESFPQYVWWWPAKCTKNEHTQPLIDSQLLVHLPFDLLKEFLPRKKNDTVTQRFKQLLRDFFGHNVVKSPSSFECVAKVYRLLYDIYQYEKDPRYHELKYQLYEIAADFATQAPEYDEQVKKDFKALSDKSGLLASSEMRPDMTRRNWVEKIDGNKNYKPSEGDFVLTQDHLPEEKNPIQATLAPHEQAEAEKRCDVSYFRRRALYLKDDFYRSLDALICSGFLSEFPDLKQKSGVKSETSVTRKMTTFPDPQSDLSPAEKIRKNAERILDYLRGTIFVADPKACERPRTMLQQVEALLDAIEKSIGVIERVKLDHCAKGKGFILMNVRFKKDGISLVAEIQIRIPALKSATAPPDDHIKHEVERTWSQCLTSDLPLSSACIDFFAEPCKNVFQPFSARQRVTLHEGKLKPEIQHAVVEKESDSAPKPHSYALQWIQELERFPNFLRSTQAATDAETAPEAIQKVWQPVYVEGKDRPIFLRGVKYGFKIVWEAIQRRTDFVDGSKFASDKLIWPWFARQLFAARSQALKDDKELGLTRKSGDLDEKSETKSSWDCKSGVWDFAPLANNPTEAEILSAVQQSEGAFVVGVMAACRFCRKNRIGELLRDDRRFISKVLPHLVGGTKLPDVSQERLIEGAVVFGILSTLALIPSKAHYYWSNPTDPIERDRASEELAVGSFAIARKLASLPKDRESWDGMMKRELALVVELDEKKKKDKSAD